MDGETQKQVVVMVKPKTGAPMVLGTIAFILSLPGILCATICSAAVSGVSEGRSSLSGLVWVLVVVAIVNLIASFKCKGRNSKGAGILIICLSVPFMILGVLLGGPFNFVPSVLYFISGAYCISNASRPAA